MSPFRPKARHSRLILAALAAALALAACGSDSSSGSDTNQSGPEPTRVEFDPTNFVDPTTSTNEYHPLTPGMQWVRGGTTEVGARAVPHQVITTMTDVIRMIDGVPAVAMLDQSTDAGEVAQVGFDYMALDEDGSVWILGGYTEDYEGGEFTNAEDAWLGAETGADPGILMPGDVTADTPRWFIGAADADEDGSVAEPVEVGIERCVEFDCFQDVLVVREGEIGAIDNEFKYYAPGIGVVDNVPQDESLHQDTFELLNFVELGPEGLAEASQIVLDLEAHAREVVPEVFGSAPEARRAS